MIFLVQNNAYHVPHLCVQASKEVYFSSTNLTTALPIEQMTNSKDSQFAQYCLRAQMKL